MSAAASLLLGEAQGWTKRFADRAAADAFVRSRRVESVVEKGLANGTEMLFSVGVPLPGASLLGAALGRRFDRGFDDPDRTTSEVEGRLRLELGADGGQDELGGRLHLGATMSVTVDHLAHTRTDTLRVAHDTWGAIGALVGERLLGGARSGQLAGEAALAATHDEDGRPLELRVTTVASRDGGATLERTVRSLDLTAPAHEGLAAQLSPPSASPATRAGDLARVGATLGAGLGSRYTWGVVVHEGYRRSDDASRDVTVDPGVGGSASLQVDAYELTDRSVE